MKDIVILLGLLLVSLARSEEVSEDETPMDRNLAVNFRKCAESINPTYETLRDVMEGRDLNHRDGNCFRACILNELGILRDAKANVMEAEEFFKSGNDDPTNVEELLRRMETECQEKAETSDDECIVTESYAKCFVKIRNEIVAAKRDGDDLSYKSGIF